MKVKDKKDEIICWFDILRKFGLKTVAVLSILVGLFLLVANHWLNIQWPYWVIASVIAIVTGMLLFILLVIRDIIYLKRGGKSENGKTKSD